MASDDVPWQIDPSESPSESNVSALPTIARKPYRLRDATTDDVPAIHAIYAHHVQHGRASFEEVAPTVDEMRHRFGEVLKKGLPYIVAERDGEILGYAYASSYRARSAYRFAMARSPAASFLSAAPKPVDALLVRWRAGAMESRD